jgi:hypothetical protein
MSSARKSKRQPLLTLGHIRAKKARSLIAFCRACSATRILEVDEFPDTTPLKWFEAHMTCQDCGGKVEVTPLWRP